MPLHDDDYYVCLYMLMTDRKLVKFEFEDQMYQFTALPQGLECTAPGVVTKKPFLGSKKD